jgi:KDO2-lipid IV(A) lauroyltransferase
MPGLRDRLTVAGYGLGWSVVCRLPEAFMARCFRLGADLAWRRRGSRVLMLEANLRRVIGATAPEARLRELSRLGMRSYARYWLEAFRLPVMRAERLTGGAPPSGHFQDALDHLAAGRGVIFAVPHMGNYDQAGAWMAAQGAGTVTAVAERLEPDGLFDRFVAFRERLGMEVLPASGGSGNPFGILARRLRTGNIAVLVCDRDVTGGGIQVEFFGEKCRMMGGAAALALHTGAALMPVILWFEGDGWGVHVAEEIRVPDQGSRRERTVAMMQEVAAAFETGIRAHPQDWHMLQPVFSSDVDAAGAAG